MNGIKTLLVWDREIGGGSALLTSVQGETLLERFLRLTDEFDVVVISSFHDEIRGWKKGAQGSGSWQVQADASGVGGIPVPGHVWYDERRLRARLRSGKEITPAVLWVFRTPEDVEALDREEPSFLRSWALTRWVNFPLAQWLARRLTAWPWVTPEIVTFASLAAGIGSGIGFALEDEVPWISVFLLQGHLILSYVDGHLAKLTGRVSPRGTYLNGLSNRIVKGGLMVSITYVLRFEKVTPYWPLGFGVIAVFGLFMEDYRAELNHWAGVFEGAPRRVWTGWKGVVSRGWDRLEWRDVRIWFICFMGLTQHLKVLMLYFALELNMRWVLAMILDHVRYFREDVKV